MNAVRTCEIGSSRIEDRLAVDGHIVLAADSIEAEVGIAATKRLFAWALFYVYFVGAELVLFHFYRGCWNLESELIESCVNLIETRAVLWRAVFGGIPYCISAANDFSSNQTFSRPFVNKVSLLQSFLRKGYWIGQLIPKF